MIGLRRRHDDEIVTALHGCDDADAEAVPEALETRAHDSSDLLGILRCLTEVDEPRPESVAAAFLPLEQAVLDEGLNQPLARRLAHTEPPRELRERELVVGDLRELSE